MCEQNNMPEENESKPAEIPTEPVTAEQDAPPKKGKAGRIVLRALLIVGIILLALVALAVITVFVMRARGRESLKVDDFTISPPTEV
ncbi:MAG: hypothetical protein IJ519_04175 [Clostridia bacterium]|nr:hypothetical protein [Clostridia bacterium]